MEVSIIHNFMLIERIYELLVLPMELHTNCTKCCFMGDTTIYLGFIVHENNTIANEEKITTIHDLTTPTIIHQEGSYLGLAWFYIPFIKNHSSMLTFFIGCTRKGKIRPTEELRMRFREI